MSDVFANQDTSLGGTLSQGLAQAAEAKAKLKDKAEATSKTVEESLASLKVLMGSKGVSKAIIENPLVRQFASQAKKRAIDGIKDTVNKAVTKVTDLLPKSNFEMGEAADQAELAGIRANGAARLGQGEDVFREGYQGGAANTASGEENLLNGTGALYRRSDLPEETDDFQDAEAENLYDNAGLAKALPEDDVAAGEFGTEASAGLTEAQTARAAQLTSNIASRASTAVASATPEVDVLAGTAVKTAADTTLDAAGSVAAGDVAVGAGEAALGALDAIPGLDIFTLIAGAALGIGAAAKKRVPHLPVMPPPPQNHVSFAANFQNV